MGKPDNILCFAELTRRLRFQTMSSGRYVQQGKHI